MFFLFNIAGKASHWFECPKTMGLALDAHVRVPTPKCCVTGRLGIMLLSYCSCLWWVSLLVHGFCLSGWPFIATFSPLFQLLAKPPIIQGQDCNIDAWWNYRLYANDLNVFELQKNHWRRRCCFEYLSCFFFQEQFWCPYDFYFYGVLSLDIPVKFR